MIPNLNRRQLGGVSASAIAAGALGPMAVRAQGSTPESDDTNEEEAPVYEGLPPEFDVETNWPVENRDLAATREARGSSISTETAATLGLAWDFPLTGSSFYGAMVASPVVVGNVIYAQDTVSNVYAIDLETGALLWEKKYDQPVASGGPNGVAVAYGMAFYCVGGQGEVVAIDASTGEDIWSVSIQGPRLEAIDMAPSVFDGLVYFSTIPGNLDGFYQSGQRGVIHALDVATGAVVWYFDTTTDNLWGNARVNCGGGLWHPPSFDIETGAIYAGTGNAGPFPLTPEFPNGSSRPGDNDYCNSILAINPATAGLDWYSNLAPFDLFDRDNQLSPVLADIEIAGEMRKIVISTGKHGRVFAFDRETGEELWQTPVGKHQNDDVIELPTMDEESLEVFPGSHGGVQTPVAYKDGVLFAPVINWASWYWATGFDGSKRDFALSRGEIVAIDAATGEILWSVETPTGPYGSTVVVNDILFTGGLDGIVRGLNTADGSTVWTSEQTAGLNAPFAISGDYLIVPAAGIFIPSSERPEGPAEVTFGVKAYKLGLS